jgi:hypothetical protein
MSWTKGLDNAPKDRPILARHPDWLCPAVIQYETYEGVSYWLYSETLIADIIGAVGGEDAPEELDGIEWLEIPE